jgi:general secretion pathway protein M
LSAVSTSRMARDTGVLEQRFKRLSSRERMLVVFAGLAITAAVLWWLLLAPALRTLSAAPEQIAALESQLAQMRQWATEAEQLKQAPRRTPPSDFAATVTQRIKRALGDSQRVNALPAEVRITTTAVGAAALLTLLQDVGESAQAKVDEMILSRNPDGTLKADIKWVPRSGT